MYLGGLLLAVMQYLHDAVHGAEGVCFLIKVFREAGLFREAGCMAVAAE